MEKEADTSQCHLPTLFSIITFQPFPTKHVAINPIKLKTSYRCIICVKTLTVHTSQEVSKIDNLEITHSQNHIAFFIIVFSAKALLPF